MLENPRLVPLKLPHMSRWLLTGLLAGLLSSARVDAASPVGPINEEAEPNAGFANTAAGNELFIVAGVASGDYKAKDAGYALVFRKRGKRWTLEDGLFDPDAREGDRFGWRVTVAGSTAFVSVLSRYDSTLTRMRRELPSLTGNTPTSNQALFSSTCCGARSGLSGRCCNPMAVSPTIISVTPSPFPAMLCLWAHPRRSGWVSTPELPTSSSLIRWATGSKHSA